jgi:signal transduction histidine kinase
MNVAKGTIIHSGRSLINSLINEINTHYFWVVILFVLLLAILYQDWPWSNIRYLNNLAIIEMQNRVIGLLFLIPLVYTAFAFPWKQVLVVSVISLAGVFPIILDVWYMSSAVTNIGYLLIPAFLAAITSLKIESQRREKTLQSEREHERKIYIAKVLESQENERRRIAQELHDETIQTLLVLANQSNDLAINDFKNEEEMKAKASWIRDSTLSTIDDLRRICLDLRPIILDTLGLVSALNTLVDAINRESNGLQASINVIGQEVKMSPKIEITVFRIVQEALNNIKQHSGADTAVITLKLNPNELNLTIEDNGRGFVEPKRFDELGGSNRLGLLGMKQRIDLLGGKFNISSKAGEGTKISIYLKGASLWPMC